MAPFLKAIMPVCCCWAGILCIGMKMTSGSVGPICGAGFDTFYRVFRWRTGAGAVAGGDSSAGDRILAANQR